MINYNNYNGGISKYTCVKKRYSVSKLLNIFSVQPSSKTQLVPWGPGLTRGCRSVTHKRICKLNSEMVDGCLCKILIFQLQLLICEWRHCHTFGFAGYLCLRNQPLLGFRNIYTDWLKYWLVKILEYHHSEMLWDHLISWWHIHIIMKEIYLS